MKTFNKNTIILWLNIYIVSAVEMGIKFSFIGLIDVPTIRLNTGYEMPVIGIGTWQAKGSQVLEAVEDAVEVGYRHIDTAWYYQNEKQVGKAVRRSIKKKFCQREDIFITTKVWPTIKTRREALNIIKRSLKELNTTYIDLVLIHWPSAKTTELYKGLEMAFNQKLVRSLGVSNFGVNHLKDLLKTAKIKPAVNQIRIHPKLNQEDIVKYCKQKSIAVTGYSPLGTGSLIADPTLIQIGKKHGKTSAQVMIRWQIQRGLVVIPKSIRKDRILENFDVFDFKLSSKDMKTIYNMTQLENDFDYWT